MPCCSHGAASPCFREIEADAAPGHSEAATAPVSKRNLWAARPARSFGLLAKQTTTATNTYLSDPNKRVRTSAHRHGHSAFGVRLNCQFGGQSRPLVSVIVDKPTLL